MSPSRSHTDPRGDTIRRFLAPKYCAGFAALDALLADLQRTEKERDEARREWEAASSDWLEWQSERLSLLGRVQRLEEALERIADTGYGKRQANASPSRPRVFRERRGFTLVIGPWAARFSWSRSGHFANGSRWFTGWHRWGDDAEL